MTRNIDTSHYKTLLEAELAKLEGELQTLGRRNPSNPADWEPVPEETEETADPNERADKFEEFEDRAAILNQLEIQFNEVKDALERIEKGTYGICEVSGEEIEEARLNANPAARTCIAHVNG